MTDSEQEDPRGELVIRTLAMPADTNPAGDIFGGWLLAKMDIAGGVLARNKGSGRVATVAVDTMTFYNPVFVGDVVCCYADMVRIGRTSMTVHIQAWAQRDAEGARVKVTEGVFTYVAIDENRKPRPVEG
ncbi:acyl-CoA thioester hydrolase YciA [Hwanghaeella grinnelliae]|uniref:Acyl-CoA thioester hydrolase YciA n=1 Tax=Hwanghaeella grinnelliae TaxID=2500179 RepID=A0A437QXL6_9PROT|nr:acyl-CoA thioester hydrolase YciA [Hwanghaeella grinnelliae]RVU39271.1 acyl-CoA thioester hydrolase YciA [Hwanghaeella grinnelliae]